MSARLLVCRRTGQPKVLPAARLLPAMAAIGLALACLPAVSAAAARGPNIVLIVADDKY